MNILVVDDVPVNRRLLRAQLEAEGHDVQEAGNGVEALEAMSATRVDAVISDILMPEMDGFRLCLELRRQEQYAALPFVLYTSTYNSPSDRQLARSVGADAYLTKPSPVVQILAAIRAAAVMDRSGTESPGAPPDESTVLRQYNAALVRKLEEKNDELAGANEHLRELNEQLEQRVAQRTRELEVANRELEAFSSSVAHDLRSPLSAISGFVGLLETGFGSALPAEGHRYLEVIKANVERMARLIEDLLSLARMDQHELVRETVDLERLAAECLQSLREEYAGREIEVSLGALPTCACDPVLVRQVLHNLIGNAFKYTGNVPRPRVEIGTETRDGDRVIYVRDNGAGFDMRYADRLFTAFQRLHAKREFEGTGLGLAIVGRIVERHGGRTWATGATGQGATFFFTLGPQFRGTSD